MPAQDSAKIISSTGDKKLHALLRAHRIAIYPEATVEVERNLR
jgi:hypothetical protein